MLKTKLSGSLIALLIAMSFSTYAQDTSAIQKRLQSQYALTQPTADNSDIITAGAVVVLQKEKLKMVAVSSAITFASTYKDGKISLGAAGFASKVDRILKVCPWCPHPATPPAPATRDFLKNEKMWVTRINVKADSVVFDLFTDPDHDQRFKASLVFQFPKGPMPSADDVAKLVAEVFMVQPSGDESAGLAQAQPGPSDGSRQQVSPGQAGTAEPPAVIPPPPPADGQSTPQSGQASEPPAVIPPPPPPPPDAPVSAPKTFTLAGQTPDQVVAALGQPEKIVKISAAKQIYYYKDLKVIFVGGKVTDAQ